MARNPRADQIGTGGRIKSEPAGGWPRNAHPARERRGHGSGGPDIQDLWHRCCASHEREGSEYPAVVIPVMTQHYAMLQRNLIYTGVTRGKKLVVLVGQKKAVAIAVKNVSGRSRWSKLDEWLRSQ